MLSKEGGFMFKDLDSRTQLALSLMATEKVYNNWMAHWETNPNGLYDSDKFSLHINPHNLNFYVWRKGKGYAHTSVYMQHNPQGYCFISVENYYRGVARDTLELNKPNATFDDYLKLANNFPEQTVEVIVNGLSDGFTQHGLLSEYSYYLGVATTLLDLKE